MACPRGEVLSRRRAYCELRDPRLASPYSPPKTPTPVAPVWVPELVRASLTAHNAVTSVYGCLVSLACHESDVTSAQEQGEGESVRGVR